MRTILGTLGTGRHEHDDIAGSPHRRDGRGGPERLRSVVAAAIETADSRRRRRAGERPDVGGAHAGTAERISQSDPADAGRHSPRRRAAVFRLHVPRQEGSVGIQPDQAVPGSGVPAVVVGHRHSVGHAAASARRRGRRRSASWRPSSRRWNSWRQMYRAASSRRCRRTITKCGCSC